MSTEGELNQSLKLYVIAGEASGDLHGSNLIAELKKQHGNLQVRAWGGDRMEAAGAEIVKHYRELAFMGFVEVVANLKQILRNIAQCKSDIASWKPDAVILIDYPGFNMRIGPYLKKLGIPVFYYISPQIWAWKQSRVHKIKEFVDRMFVILPFEKEFYQRFDMDVDFVGHPLIDAIAHFNNEPIDETAFRKEWRLEGSKPLILMMPGSRRQEVSVMLPLMLEAAGQFEDFELVVAAAPSLEESFYREVVRGKDVKIIHGKTYSLLGMAHAAMVTSGTATLETALFGVPQVVCYKGSFISYLIARQLIKVDFISLVNLVMKRKVVTELIQSGLTPETLTAELKRIIGDTPFRSQQLADYDLLKQELGGEGASALTASLMLKTLKDPS